jgi:hypothetical protein
MPKLLSAVVCSLMLLPGSASATCIEANLTGFWKLYAASSSGSGVAWYKCSLYMTTTGAITSASSCQNNFSQSTPVTGRVSLASGPNCTFVGSIHQTYTGITDSVTEATMSIDKRTASGVGIFSGGAFIFTMVKVR